MFIKLITILLMYSIVNNVSAYPVEILKSIDFTDLPFLFHVVNSSNALVYQGYNLNEDQQMGEKRTKRFLEDLIDLYNLFANYDDYDEDDSSSEEEESSSSDKENNKNGFVSDLCRNCSVSVNKIQQVQHIQHNISPSTMPATETYSKQTPLNDNQNSSSTPKTNISTKPSQKPIGKQQPDNIYSVKETPAKEESFATTNYAALETTIATYVPVIATTGNPVEAAVKTPVVTDATIEVKDSDISKNPVEIPDVVGTTEALITAKASSETTVVNSITETPVVEVSTPEASVAEKATTVALTEDKIDAVTEPPAEAISTSEAPA